MALAVLLAFPTGHGLAQAPNPVMMPTTSMKLVAGDDSPVGAAVPVARVMEVERLLAKMARDDAMSIATTYARSDPKWLPGVQKLGEWLETELSKPGTGFDFPGLVSHNPAFWLAERELAPGDVSLPYLVSMLAILNRNFVTAARTIALAQATLPLTPTVRRGYARPEAMLLYLDTLLLAGIPASSQMQNVAQCDESIKRLRSRIVEWSNRPGLLRALIELEARRAEFLVQGGGARALWDRRLGDLLEATPEDLAFVQYDDPILATALASTVRQWLNKETLAQQWSRWIEFGHPAELNEVEASVAAFAAHGRADLAWLAWRQESVLRPISNPQEQNRWKAWCGKLLNAPSAAYVATTTEANPRAGTASLPVEIEGFSEAWSGDQGIHPLLAIKIDRQIAIVDAMLAVMPVGSSGEGGNRLRRAELLAEIDAVEPSRRELQRVLEIIHHSDRIVTGNGIRVIDWVKVIEARLLDTERHYGAAETIYKELIRNPRLEGVKRNYAAHLYMAEKLGEAHAQYRELALKHKDDTYRAIMSDLTARRLGKRETGILRAAQRNVAPESWPAVGVRFLLGEISQDELLQRAHRGTTFEIIDHECESSFWIAEVALAEGRLDECVKWLERCVGTGYMSDAEFKIAKAQLERLTPKPEGKDKKPENSNGVITT